MTEEKSFQILVALATRPLHGYAIRQEVEARTDGQVRLWPTTLYGLLAELTSRGLIEETDHDGGPDDDPRRRYYALTREGRKHLTAEAARLEGLARLARTNLGLGKARA
ncbi:MAG TPA: helix-turn-helix transcriptional regulator [Gemmatimonadales bacterium]|nr:helix-turn-helix transcriptional regulator [Gemmatimonadales bacterium]